MKKNLNGKTILISIVWLLAYNTTKSQTVEELSAKYPNDYAVILNETRETKIYLEKGKPQAQNKIVEEILILDDKANGLYNKHKIYHGSFRELKDIEAYTKVPEGNGYKKLKVSEIKTDHATSESVFYDDVKESVFDFPSLTKGSIAYVSYTTIDKDAHLLTPYYFMSYIPIIHQKYTISYPNDMEMVFTQKNTDPYHISIEEDNKGRTHGKTFTANFIKDIDRYSNMPAVSYYEPHLITRIASFKNDIGETERFLSDTNDLYKLNYSFLKDLNTTKDPLIQKLADSLTNGASNDREKAKRIYKWIQKNMKYVAFEDGMEGFIPRQASLVCSRRFGDCKDMSSLLTALLKAAGLQAYYTWIGTRDIPYKYEEVPMPMADNHMITTLKIGNEWLFLDGTSSTCIFGYPSGFIQGKQAFVSISPTEYKFLQVPEVPAEKNEVVDSTFISITDKGIKGNSSVYYKGYMGSETFGTLQYKDETDLKDYVKYRMGKASNKFILGNYKINYVDDDLKIVNIQADYDIPDYGKKLGDEIYLNMNLEKFFTNGNVIDTAKEKVGIESNYAYTINQYTTLDVPTGYKATEVPKNFAIDNTIMNFKIDYKIENNKLVCSQHYTYKLLFLPDTMFDLWNKTIKQILIQYKNQIVLQKQKV